MKNENKMRGFTLLELMVAISIFAGLIILVVGSFASSVSYQRRVKVNREVSQAARNVLDSISREVELSLNQPITGLSNTEPNTEPVYNFAVLKSKGAVIASESGSVLIVRDETDHCRRYYLEKGKLAMQMKEEAGCQGRFRTEPNYLTNDNVDITGLEFEAMPNTKSAQSQSYLKIKLTLNNSQEFFKNELQISMSPETMVTIRNDGEEGL